MSDLLEPIRKNEADLVIGSRFVGDVKSEFQTTFMRRFGISVISNLIKGQLDKEFYKQEVK
ncbi:protein of unknown function [Streptococcus thermophilus]|uniref:Glycosyltransferase n=1 Tax=Streptococcus thermophilus TaxID=1308 RepID=A0A4Y5FSF6_STRTR|nr:glycosyl transferase, truncated [Streptococcus thermophilus CNRZ1066]QBS00381.1 glycosyltransferase [Streptococcus thermophilus]CAD0120231.1 protein of unknown function [Streptococcus thermophilus]CAD0128223.1 protein of unknown function [Streptococcus thermophilus]CAD0164356.1 protein of unknown function [Streptococcus thermophilus]